MTEKLEITELYAFVAQNEEGEGIVACMQMIEGRPTYMPLVGADMKRIQSLYPIAEQICKIQKTPFRIYRFDNRTDITAEVDPLRV